MKTKKKAFQMPHLFWIMMGLLLAACIATYFIPAGEFAVDGNGQILNGEFHYLGYQTPVNPWQALMLFLDGMTGSGVIIFTVMISGASIGVIMDTGAIDQFLNWSIYKLKDKNDDIMVIIMFVLMTYLGSFGGTDALIAVVPIGILFAKKMKLDPITALGVTAFANMIGFGTGPTKQITAQMLMGVKPYAAFFTMFISMNFFMIVGLVMLLSYTRKLKKDKQASPLYGVSWNPDNTVITEQDKSHLKETSLSWRSVLILLVFLGQYIVIVAYSFAGGDKLFEFMFAVNMIVTVFTGILGGMSADEIGNSFAKGLASCAFIGFVIGLARVLSLILTDGHIIHTIVYAFTRPLMGMSKTVSSLGMTAVISVINMVIPSANSKAAILIPIIKPITEALKLDPNLAIQAFQYGDGFTNLICPFSGWTVGACAMAGVPFDKWFKWAFPKVMLMILLAFAWMFVLTVSGWSAF